MSPNYSHLNTWWIITDQQPHISDWQRTTYVEFRSIVYTDENQNRQISDWRISHGNILNNLVCQIDWCCLLLWSNISWFVSSYKLMVRHCNFYTAKYLFCISLIYRWHGHIHFYVPIVNQEVLSAVHLRHSTILTANATFPSCSCLLLYVFAARLQ